MRLELPRDPVQVGRVWVKRTLSVQNFRALSTQMSCVADLCVVALQLRVDIWFTCSLFFHYVLKLTFLTSMASTAFSLLVTQGYDCSLYTFNNGNLLIIF